MKYTIVKFTIENADKSYLGYFNSKETDLINTEIYGYANTVKEAKQICKEYGIQ